LIAWTTVVKANTSSDNPLWNPHGILLPAMVPLVAAPMQDDVDVVDCFWQFQTFTDRQRRSVIIPTGEYSAPFRHNVVAPDRRQNQSAVGIVALSKRRWRLSTWAAPAKILADLLCERSAAAT
jgi:hypothetical protein